MIVEGNDEKGRKKRRRREKRREKRRKRRKKKKKRKGKRTELLELREILDPPPADLGSDEISQKGVGIEKPAPRGNSIGHIGEFLRENDVEIMEEMRFKQVAMELGHSVDRVAADDGQVAHSHLLDAILLGKMEEEGKKK